MGFSDVYRERGQQVLDRCVSSLEESIVQTNRNGGKLLSRFFRVTETKGIVTTFPGYYELDELQFQKNRPLRSTTLRIPFFCPVRTGTNILTHISRSLRVRDRVGWPPV